MFSHETQKQNINRTTIIVNLLISIAAFHPAIKLIDSFIGTLFRALSDARIGAASALLDHSWDTKRWETERTYTDTRGRGKLQRNWPNRDYVNRPRRRPKEKGRNRQVVVGALSKCGSLECPGNPRGQRIVNRESSQIVSH